VKDNSKEEMQGVSKHIQEHTTDNAAESSSDASPVENPYSNMKLEDPYSSGLDNTLEGFGKSKKNFNASDMFGVAPVKDESEEGVEETND